MEQDDEQFNQNEDGNGPRTLQPELNQQEFLQIPNFSEEYLNQLSEEQLEQLLQ